MFIGISSYSVRFCTVLYGSVRFSTALYVSVWLCTVLYLSVWFCTALYVLSTKIGELDSFYPIGVDKINCELGTNVVID